MYHPDQRRRRRTYVGIVAAALSMMAVSACTGPSTQIEQSWTAPDPGRAPLNHVVTVFFGPDGATRRSAEDRMAQQLARSGVYATPAYALLTSTELQDLDQVRPKLRAAGIDGVVTMRLVDKETVIESSPMYLDSYWDLAWPYGYGYGYGYGWGYGYGPGYTYTETIVQMETNAYSLVDNKLVWSGLSRTINPEDTRELLDEVTQVATNELSRRGVLGRPENVAQRPVTEPGAG